MALPAQGITVLIVSHRRLFLIVMDETIDAKGNFGFRVFHDLILSEDRLI
jgi:hypothetical protein